MKLRTNGLPDMRFRESRQWATKQRKELIKACMLAVLLAFLIACAGVTFLTRPKTFSEPIFDIKQDYIDTQYPENFYEHVEPVAEPISERNCYQNIDKIRCIGEDLGYGNDVIKTMIRIARSESNFRSEAKNGSSTASGIFQFLDSSWKYYKCSGDKLNAEDSINCAYRAYSKDGFRPWASSSSKWL